MTQGKPGAPSPSGTGVLTAALTHQQAGRLAEAAALYDRLLAQDPNNAQALLLLAVIRIDEKALDAAEELLSRCLALTPANPLALHNLGKVRQLRGDDDGAIGFYERATALKPAFAPTFNDLGVSLHQLGRYESALAAFDRAVAIDPGYTMAHCNRGRVLLALDRSAEAAQVFQQILATAPATADMWNSLGIAALHMDALDQAEEAFRQAVALDPGALDAHLKLAETLDRAHRPVEAAREYAEWARRQGVSVIGCLGDTPEARVLLVGGTEPCNTPTEALFGRRRFEKIVLYFLPPGDSDVDLAALAATLPPYDIVFNTIGDADRGAPYLPQAEALFRHLDRPILNPPEQILLTRRDMITQRLAGIPGLAIPETTRVTRAALQALASGTTESAWPMLVRPPGTHGGIDLKRIDGPAALAAFLEAMPFDEYYFSRYWDYRSADGYFRKYRLIFVDREVYPYHLAIADQWLVHYWRADMRRADWMREEEEAFLADYRTAFPGALGEAVREVAQRLDLDYAGMDCGITADGRVLLFEANASMLVHLNDSRDDFAYKYAHVPRIFDAVSRMVARRIAAGR